jgi:hypothetical protein
MSGMRSVFGPCREEIWRQLSETVGGHYVDGGLFGRDRVEVAHGEWTVTLDTYTVSTGKSSVTYTRMRAPFINASGFRFRIHRKNVFSGLGKLFGMQDIEIGDPDFNEHFIIQANDVPSIRRLLSNATIRDLISAQKDIALSVKDDEGVFVTRFPEGVDELHVIVHGVIKDINRLKQLYDLFAETLEELNRIGVATDDPPNVHVR